MDRLHLITGFWLISYLVIYAHYDGMFVLVSAGDPFRPTTLAVYLLGVFWDLMRGAATFANRGGVWFLRPSRVALYFGGLLVVARISHLETVAQLRSFAQQAALATFDGALYLGIPLIGYRLLIRHRLLSGLSNNRVFGMFAVGGGIAVLGTVADASGAIGPSGTLWVAAVVLLAQEPLKMVALYVSREREWQHKHRLKLLVYAGALGLGSATLVSHPVALIPFMSVESQGLTLATIGWDLPRTLSIYAEQLGAAAIIAAGLAAAGAPGALTAGRRALLVLGGMLASVAFRWVFALGFASWHDGLYATGLVWLYVAAPILAIVVGLLRVHRDESRSQTGASG